MYVLGIDLGCTKFLVAIADGDGAILARTGGMTDARPGHGDAGVAQLSAAARELCGELDIELTDVASIGLGTPGPLDRASGTILSPPQLPWGDYPLGPNLSAALGGRPIAIDNDCKAGGLGELRRGAGRGARSMVYFGVGTGIGGCVIADGRIQYGASDNASELGHLCVWMGGPECGCGSEGCLEGIASGSGLERRARTAASTGRAPSLLALAGGDVDAIDGALVAGAAAEGDEIAMELWEDATVAMGAAVASMVNALSPDVVVIGGGIACKHGAPWIERIAQDARRRSIGPNADHVDVRLAELGDDCALVGAIEMALDLAAHPVGA